MAARPYLATVTSGIRLVPATVELMDAAVIGDVVLFAGSLAAFLAARPTWLRVQRHLMGGILGAFAIRLATDSTRPVAG